MLSEACSTFYNIWFFHGLDINNQRFYCNPITGKIEPIAFDSYDNAIDFIKISIKEFTDLLNSIIGTNPGNIFYKHLILELEKYSELIQIL